ncbi:MAG: hypothetical protein M1546_21840 [Chloroflexi bacterium]|nr:hypothetical protein [Chloroflexota bacterium]
MAYRSRRAVVALGIVIAGSARRTRLAGATNSLTHAAAIATCTGGHGLDHSILRAFLGNGRGFARDHPVRSIRASRIKVAEGLLEVAAVANVDASWIAPGTAIRVAGISAGLNASGTATRGF